jgi:excisionase family DNA binding protein
VQRREAADERNQRRRDRESPQMMKPRNTAEPIQIMSVKEVARYLHVHPTTVYRLLHKRQIPAFKIGSEYRFERASIVRWTADKQAKI